MLRLRWVIRGLLLLLIGACLAAAAWLLVRGMREAEMGRRIAAFHELIVTQSQQYDLDRALIYAVITVESSGRANARSGKDARGLMQIRPIAQREVQRVYPGTPDGNLFDPTYNVRIGTAYLSYLMKRFDGDLHIALAAYNAGPTRLAQLRRKHADLPSAELVGMHTPRETQNYVVKVLHYQDYWQRQLATAGDD